MKSTLLVLAGAASSVGWITSLERNHFIVKKCTTEQELLAASSNSKDVVLIRLNRDQRHMPELVDRLRSRDVAVILIQAKKSWDLAMAARACGVRDYLREPVSAADLIASVE